MYTGCMPYDTVCFTMKATTQSGFQGSERFSLSNPGHVIREPSHNGLGAARLQGPWTLHASKQSSHGSLETDNTHRDWLGATQGGDGSPNMGDDSTGTVLSYQLEDAVYQSNTMYNMALSGQLFHPLAESHGQASMEVEEDISHTATLHGPQVQIRQWALPLQDSLAGLGHGHPIWEAGHPGFLWNTHGIQRYFTY